jgi:hypothetical protein
MFNSLANFGDVARAIQLALAPVFLLTGIGAILNVMAGRLARIIHRGRQLTEHPVGLDLQRSETLQVELRSLERRRHLTSIAITASTLSALLVCLVIAALFLEVLLQFELKWLVGTLFTGSAAALVVGLTYFLREVHLAMQTVRIPAMIEQHGNAGRQSLR